MTGNRSEGFYVSKYGDVEGRKKYEELCRRRSRREERAGRGRSIKLGDDLEAELVAGNAVKCIACGYIGTTLQWTHFKYKCSGEYKTSKDYLTAFPDAKIRAENLQAVLKMTLANLVDAYGEEEGARRWNAYCSRQAETNTFEYKAQTFGMSISDFEEYNLSRSVTLKNMIERHGEVEGSRRWQEYCDRQRYTTTISYFIGEYGEEEGRRKYANFENGKRLDGRGVSRQEDEVYGWLAEHFPVQRQAHLPNTSAFDFKIGNKLVEYYGSYWHCDPRRYEADFVHPTLGKTAGFIWERDARKRKIATDLGYEVYVLHEADFLADKQGSIKSILRWLGEDGSGEGRQS